MPELTDPPPPAWRAVLRRAVVDHALGEHRHRHPALLHVGRPGGAEVVVAADLDARDIAGATGATGEGPSGDLALRVDVVAALLRRAAREAPGAEGPSSGGAPPLVWLTRAGPLDLQDVDAAWVAAATQASQEAGSDLTMVVVNRHGWRDPRSGASRHWQRIRRR